jgi:C_GCAxxG_C_C family probable redox protein
MSGNRVELALKNMGQGYNCCQSILAAYADGLDLMTALKLATGFGGGMGRMGKTCGVVTGAIMVLGLRHGPATLEDLPPAKERTAELVRQFMARFEKRNGSVECKQLLNCAFSQPGEFERAKQSDLLDRLCPKFMRDAAEILDDLG